MIRSLRSQALPLVAMGIALTLLASACSSSPVANRKASGASAGDPTTLPALPGTAATGERAPVWTGAVLTPSSWVSTSLTPTLSVPGATGAWTFTLTDLSDGTSSFGTKTYSEVGSSSRVPLGAGLQQGHVYTWKATSTGQQPVGGSFMVDLQVAGVQQLDSVGGLNVGLSSGEASVAWSSHTVASVPGSVGFGLQFQKSNESEPGLPEGWTLQAASSSEYRRIVVAEDGSVGLVGTNGTVSNYRKGPGGAYTPVQLGSGDVNTNGLAPVLIGNADGSFSVTTKGSTALFVLDGDSKIAYLSSITADSDPVLGQKWTGGRLQSISDPVSGRSVTFVYGGGECPKPVSGFVVAPKGMLCSVKFWDGSTAAISYVAVADHDPTIGRITDYPEAKGDGASVFDVAYDASGRIARTRSPRVAVAAASNVIGAEDSQFWTEVTYAADGRVATVTEGAAKAGAQRCTRTYANEGSLSAVDDSCFGGRVLTLEFDPTTFFTINATNAAGQKMSNGWNFTTGQLEWSSDYAGLVTTNRYEGGDIVQTWGPSKASSSNAQSTMREYDQTFVGTDGAKAMLGLDATYWPSATASGEGGVQELGPTLDGKLVSGLTVNWPTSPAGNGGGWSGLLTGTLDVATAGEYGIASGNSTAKVRINNVLCVDGACDRLPLEKGRNQIRIDLASTSSAAAMDVTWTGPDSGGVSKSIPMSALHPGYGYVTTTKVSDPTAVATPQENVSRSIYDAPSSGRVSSRLNQAGTKVSFAYEGGKGGSGGWQRQTSVTSASGASYTYAYWGDRESAKSACPGATSANQAGGSKTVTAPGADGSNGPTTMNWYDEAGRLVASRAPGGAMSCRTYGKAGQVLATELIGMGEVQKSTTNYSVGGNPLVVESTETIGSKVTTTRTESDLLGRIVRVVDRFGIETNYTFDNRTGQVATVTTVTPGAAPVVAGYTYDQRGWMTVMTVNGAAVGVLVYNGDGTVATVTFGNGVVTSLGYDAQNRMVSSSSTTSAGTIADARVISAGGNISSETLSGPTGSAAFSYEHDGNGRLSKASVTGSLVPVTRSWEWAFDAASNRIAQRIIDNGAVSGEYTYTYNGASQLTSTTDPSASAGITYDDRGNATKVGADSFTYDAANRLSSATDGTITVAYERDLDGAVVAKTTTGGPGAGTIRYSASGVLLDADSRPTSQQFALPIGVTLTLPVSGGAAGEVWQHTTLDGDLFFTTNGTGAVQGAVQVFDPYGQVLTTPNAPMSTMPNTTFEAAAGNETEPLKLTYQLMGARVYIPALGRFAQLDPIVGGSANGYDYVNQDPVNNTDPTGNDSENWLVTGLTALASFGVAALVAPARGALVGMVVGALTGAAVAGASHAIEYFATGQTEFSAIRMGLSVLAGAAGGGILGRVKWAKAQNRAGGNVNGNPGGGGGGAARPVQPPALPRQNLGAYQGAYNRAYARSIAQQSQQANPLLTGQLLFGVIEDPARVAARQAAVADRYALNIVGRVQQRAAAVAQAQQQAALRAQQTQQLANDLFATIERALAGNPYGSAAAAA